MSTAELKKAVRDYIFTIKPMYKVISDSVYSGI